MRQGCRESQRSYLGRSTIKPEGNPVRKNRLREQKSAEAIVPQPSRTGPPRLWRGHGQLREGPNVKEDKNLNSSRDEQRRPTFPDRDTAETDESVKPTEPAQRAEPSPARSENLPNAQEGGVWEQIMARANLFSALNRVVRNGGAPGIDGMTVEDLRPYLISHWLEIRASLDAGMYQPSPVRRVEIAKPDGGVRLLGIPTAIDRLIQQAIAQGLTPLFEPRFSPQSYGYRPGRRAQDAVKTAQGYIRAGYTWTVDLDLEKFFDRVNHDKLMARVARVVKDRRVLALIRKYLESGVMINGVVIESEEGVPQGGPLSPLLSNVMLDDLDKELEKRGLRFVRYADDCNIYVKSQRAGERVMNSVRQFLERKLSLKVNTRKSAVDRPWKRKFLGFSFFERQGQVKIKIAGKTLDRCREKLRRLTRRTREGTLEEIIQELNQYLRGWIGYFQLADTPHTFADLEGWLRRRLRQLVWSRWKQSTTRFRNLVALGVPPHIARQGAAGTSPWRKAHSPAMQMGLNNAYWRKQGLQSITEFYLKLRST